MALLFFDVDGTIWDFDNVIPDSTRTAMRLAKENGHTLFICSGRAKVFLRSPALWDLGFDGFTGGCGTEIEYRGEELLYRTVEHEALLRAIRMCEDADMAVMLESRDALFMQTEEVGRDRFGKSIVDSMGDVIQPLHGNEANLTATKITAIIGQEDYRGIADSLRDEFEIMVHGGYVMEAVPKGYTKATSIAFLCDYLGVDRADTYAFGDGANDLEMLRFAGTGIAMGNGIDEAKAQADYVTDDIHEDGILHACRHFGLI